MEPSSRQDSGTAIPPEKTDGLASDAASSLAASAAKRKKEKKKKRKRSKATGNATSSSSTGPAGRIAALMGPLTEEQLAKLSHGDRLRRWFALMTVDERQQAVSIVDASLSDLLLSMDQKLSKDGAGLFCDAGEASFEQTLLAATAASSGASFGTARHRSSSLSNSSVAINSRLKSFRAASNRSKTRSSSQGGAAPTSRSKRNAAASPANFNGIKFFDDFFMGKETKRPDRDENFCFLKDSCLIETGTMFGLLRSDEDLRQAVRLCDTTQYLDTITLSSSVLKGRTSCRFMRMMLIASRGKFLETPCKLAYDPKSKKWSPEQPSWFVDMGWYTFGSFVAQKIESMLWMRYWRAHGIDPRSDSSIPPSISLSQLQTILDETTGGGALRFQKQLLSKYHLVDYLRSLSHSEKNGIILNIGRAVKEVVREKLNSFNYPHLLSILLAFSSPSARTLSNLDLISSPAALKNVNSEREFVELVFMSPLPRADTGMDFVLRRIGVFIQTSYTNKLSKDLILGEEMEKSSRPASSKKQSRSRKPNKLSQDQPKVAVTPSSQASSSSTQAPPSHPPTKPSEPIKVESPPSATPMQSRGPTSKDAAPIVLVKSPPAVPVLDQQEFRQHVTRVGKSHEAPEQRSYEREQALLRVSRQAESDTDDSASNPWQTRLSSRSSSRLSERSATGSYQGASAMRRKAKEAENAMPSGRGPRSGKVDFGPIVPKAPSIRKPGPLPPMTDSIPKESPKEVTAGQSATHSISPRQAAPSLSQEKRGRTLSQPTSQSTRSDQSAAPTSAPVTPSPSPRGWHLPARTAISQGSAASTTPEDDRGRGRQRRPSADSIEPAWRQSHFASSQSIQMTRTSLSSSAGTSQAAISRAKSQDYDALYTGAFSPSSPKQTPTKSKSQGKLEMKHVRTKSNPSALVSLAPTSPHQPREPAGTQTPSSLSPSASTTRIPPLPYGSPTSWSRRSTPQYGRNAWLSEAPIRGRGGRHSQHIYPSGSVSGTATPLTMSDGGCDADEHSDDAHRRRSHSPPARLRYPYPQYRSATYQFTQDAEFYVLGKEHYFAPGGLLPFYGMFPIQSLPIPISQPGGAGTPSSSPSASPSSGSSSSASSFTAMLSRGAAVAQTHPFAAGLAFGVSFPTTSVLGLGPRAQFPLSPKSPLLTQRLHEDISIFIKQMDDVMAAKQSELQQTYTMICNTVGHLWPNSNCRVELFGSFATSLCIPSSDVDIVICGLSVPPAAQHSLLAVLESELKLQSWVRPGSVTPIESATVPVIKLISKFGDLPVDITFEGLAVHHSGTAARDLVNRFAKSFPPLRPLTLILKQLVQNNNLNNAYTGGLSSYCLVLMVVSFLMQYHPPGLSSSNLGELLLDFLELYGGCFKYDRVCISVRKEHPNPHSFGPGLEAVPEGEGQLAPLTIIDPIRESNIIGKTTDSMFMVEMLFANFLSQLREFYEGPSYHPSSLHRVLNDARPSSITSPSM